MRRIALKVDEILESKGWNPHWSDGESGSQPSMETLPKTLAPSDRATEASGGGRGAAEALERGSHDGFVRAEIFSKRAKW